MRWNLLLGETSPFSSSILHHVQTERINKTNVCVFFFFKKKCRDTYTQVYIAYYFTLIHGKLIVSSDILLLFKK